MKKDRQVALFKMLPIWNKLKADKKVISMDLLQFTQLQGTLQVFC